MSTDAALLEALAVRDPRAMARARRLSLALQLLRAGTPSTEAQRIIMLRFKVGRVSAWVDVGMAADMVVEKR